MIRPIRKDFQKLNTLAPLNLLDALSANHLMYYMNLKHLVPLQLILLALLVL
jgi:hypothetical protein